MTAKPTDYGKAIVLHALRDALNGGSVKLLKASSLLAELKMASPCGEVSGSELQFASMADGVALDSGKPDRVEFCDTQGGAVFESTVGNGVTLDRPELVKGGPVKATAGTLGF